MPPPRCSFHLGADRVGHIICWLFAFCTPLGVDLVEVSFIYVNYPGYYLCLGFSANILSFMMS